MSKSLEKKRQKIVSSHVFANSGSIYIKATPKWSTVHYKHIAKHSSPGKRILLRYLSVFCTVFANSLKRSATFQSSSGYQDLHVSYSTARLPQNLGFSLKFFRQKAQKFLIGVFLKVHSTNIGANRTWSALQRFFLVNNVFSIFAYRHSNNHTHCTQLKSHRIARSTSNKRTFLLRRQNTLFRGDKALNPVRLSVPSLRVTWNRNAVETSNLLET